MAEPMYWRIAQDLRLEIEHGHLRGGEQLPTELELRERHDASRNTIRDAIKWLTNRGLVETRPGQGTFVVQKIEPFVTNLSAEPETALGGGENATLLVEGRRQHREAQIDEPVVEMQKATGTVATRLQVPEGTALVSRHQRRYMDGTPWSLQTTFYPRDFVDRGARRLIEADDIEGGAVKYLSAALGIGQVGYRDWITVRTPESTETRFFRLSDDGRVAVFEIFRTGYRDDDDGPIPFRLTVTVFPADRNQFVINAGRVPSMEAPSKGQVAEAGP
jgi:GntR family transcriptional regulator